MITTLKECVNSWIAKYNQLEADLKAILERNSSFRNVIKGLSEKYAITLMDKTNEYIVVSLPEGNNEVCVCIYVDEDEGIVLSDTLECKFASVASANEYRISDLKDSKCLAKMKQRFGKYFDPYIYMVTAKDMTGKVNYDDEITVYDYEDEKEVFEAARKLAKHLNEKYPQCFCLTIYKGYKRLLSNKMAGDPNGIYTISTKPKGETMKARRVAGYSNLEVDEYTDSTPINNNDMEKTNKKSIIVMSIVELDEDGNIDNSLERYDSTEEAEKAAEKHIQNWLKKNNYTLDEEELEENDDLVLCDREDTGNIIEVMSTETQDELYIFIKEFEV